jgi:hypothetical protein
VLYFSCVDLFACVHNQISSGEKNGIDSEALAGENGKVTRRGKFLAGFAKPAFLFSPGSLLSSGKIQSSLSGFWRDAGEANGPSRRAGAMVF